MKYNEQALNEFKCWKHSYILDSISEDAITSGCTDRVDTMFTEIYMTLTFIRDDWYKEMAIRSVVNRAAGMLSTYHLTGTVDMTATAIADYILNLITD